MDKSNELEEILKKDGEWSNDEENLDKRYTTVNNISQRDTPPIDTDTYAQQAMDRNGFWWWMWHRPLRIMENIVDKLEEDLLTVNGQSNDEVEPPKNLPTLNDLSSAFNATNISIMVGDLTDSLKKLSQDNNISSINAGVLNAVIDNIETGKLNRNLKKQLITKLSGK